MVAIVGFFAIMLLVFLPTKDEPKENSFDNWCSYYESDSETITKKECECYSEQGEVFNIYFDTNIYPISIPLKQKKHLALIDDHWKCFCLEEGISYLFQFHIDFNCDNTKTFTTNFTNRTSEFTWTY